MNFAPKIWRLDSNLKKGKQVSIKSILFSILNTENIFEVNRSWKSIYLRPKNIDGNYKKEDHC